jgi:hypothetical protein
MTLIAKPAAKVNYLNNRDILKEIHLSKNTYCSFQDRTTDHQFDMILPSVSKINQKTIAEARRNRADRHKRETGEVIDPKKIPNTEVGNTYPWHPRKCPKLPLKRKRLKTFWTWMMSQKIR